MRMVRIAIHDILHIFRSSESNLIECVESVASNLERMALGMALLSLSVHELGAFYAFRDL
jgi:hypothetical protein